MKSFVIDRKRWNRGQNQSYLLDCNDMKCCLGFLLLACGYKEKEIYGCPTPSSNFINDKSKIPNFLLKEEYYQSNTKICRDLMEINDVYLNYYCSAIGGKFETEEQREQKIKEIFSVQGIEVSFIN